MTYLETDNALFNYGLVLALPGLLSVLAALLYTHGALAYLHPEKSPLVRSKAGETEKPQINDDPFGFRNIVPVKGLTTHQKPDWPRHWKSGKYQMTMGLRKLDVNNWLNFDDQWQKEHELKRQYCSLPEVEKREIVDYLDGEDEAVCECLDMIVEYVTTRFPDMFQLRGDYITILPVQETYRIKKPFDQPPMELCGLLVSDDVYILKKGEDDLFYL